MTNPPWRNPEMRFRTAIRQTGRNTTGIPVPDAVAVLQVTGAKSDETRDRRIARSIEALRQGRVR